MSSQPLLPVYLLVGSDQPKVSLAVKRLRARFDSGSIEDVVAGSGKDEAAGDDVVAALNALGLFGSGERLVVVAGIERWKKADAEAIVSYLDSPSPGSVLALVGEPAKGSPLEAVCAKVGDVLRFDVPTRSRSRQLDYPAYVQQRFERHGRRVDHETARMLVDLVGEDAFALDAEVDKVVTWAGEGERIGPNEITALATHTSEASAFALADAWGVRDLGAVLAACEAELASPDGEPFVLAARLAGHIARVRAVQALIDAGVPQGEIPGRLGIKEYPAKKAAQHARSYTSDELGASAVALARLDHDLKGGSRVGAPLLLERTLIELTRTRDGRS
ncbi:MAG: DNA polymerase III subunit delta [Thermoleophilia bacterium]